MEKASLNKLAHGVMIGLATLCLQTLVAWAGDTSSSSSAASPTVEAALPEVAHATTEREAGKWSREWLEAHGVAVEAGYRGEVFSNLRGSLDASHRAEYLGSVDTKVALDLRKLHLGHGNILVSAQSVHGKGINNVEIGAIQAASNLDNPAFSKLIEMYYTDQYFHGRLMFKAGFLYGDGDFNVLQSASDFLNSSYGLIPIVPMPTYPDPKAGAMVSAAVSPRVTVSAGVFQGPPLETITGTSLSSGMFTIAETGFNPFPREAAFHGSYHLGIWQQTKGARLARDSGASRRNYGVYATGDHWFRKTSPSGENAGVGVFFQLGWSPVDGNEITSYWGGGMSYAAFLPRRPGDSFGVGVTHARLSASGAETVVETFYKIQITKRVCLQPDLQWVHHIAGEQHNALLAGLRFGVTF